MISYMAQLMERGLNSGPLKHNIYGPKEQKEIRIIATVCSCVSLICGLLAFFWFTRMKRKFRHTLVMTLIMSDLFNNVNYVAFSIVAFVNGTPASTSPYCQASGFMIQFGTEVTDFAVLLITVHMSLQILNPKWAFLSGGGVEKYRHLIFGFVLGVPLIMACLPFVNPNGGYTLAGAFCGLPIRPFWYRLFLSWVPRYIIGTFIVGLTISISIRVSEYQKTLERMQKSQGQHERPGFLEDGIIEEEEVDELADSAHSAKNTSSTDLVKQETTKVEEDVLTEKRRTIVEEVPVPPMPENQMQFDSEYLKKFKRQSYRRRQLPPINTAAAQDDAARNGSTALPPSVAPSSAIFSPTNFREQVVNPDMPYLNANRSSMHETASRRKSVAVMDAKLIERDHSNEPMPPIRRSSVVDSAPRSNSIAALRLSGVADRYNSIGAASRRSSIWDEIDASLEKKAANTNRMSVFTTAMLTDTDLSPPALPSVNPSPINPIFPSGLTQNPPSAPTRRPSIVRLSSVRLSAVRRVSMSIISMRGGAEEPEDPEDPATILARRHRYIKRQLRYLRVYPIIYLGIWLFPFILHVLQFTNKYAAHPPFAIVVLYIISITIFGAVNSVVFCMREKPWTMIKDTDGSIMGSFRFGTTFEPESPEMGGGEVVVNHFQGYEGKF